MELLNPPAIKDIRFPARGILDESWINQLDIEALRIEDLKQWNPVKAGRFHGHGIDFTFFQPVGQAEEANSKSIKVSSIFSFRVSVLRNSQLVFFGADIDSCSVEIDLFKLR
jgi:hypothetical protein